MAALYHSAMTEPRKPTLIGAQPAKGIVFRVYDPPKPLVDGEAGHRDFEVTKIDVWNDGSIVLSRTIKIGEKPDLRPEARLGDKVEEWLTIIAAVIDHDGHLRAESIFTEEGTEADPGLN